MDLIMDISYKIMIIGGALCMILLFFVLVGLLVILSKINNIMKDLNYRYMLAIETITMPLKFLSGLFK